MSLNFDKLLQKGKIAADNVIQNEAEIDDILKELQLSLSNFLNLEIKFLELIEYKTEPQPLGKISFYQPRVKTGFKEVHISSDNIDFSSEIFKIKRSDEVYPVTIVRGLNHSVADNKDELSLAIGEIVSNAQFHLQLKSFLNKVNNSNKS
ncbi:hypothetical protein [Psychrobium sp. 1_MG-2023]|uniref:hypothetical protein n=1 Tax=Psychrobium sp. 1_MG-2023 TaxID=3062624 RepID=UPI000C3301B7|nr:hypothetical protein [Psychrobium sp. 1_MG-2023]MDP2562835.1 hypothetical protein [Psychrobium sp. 1_MG-2023]PKF54274.1 hypothetical protein CW748_16215 [Alteromonadales bacterium alter-6D02]